MKYDILHRICVLGVFQMGFMDFEPIRSADEHGYRYITPRTDIYHTDKMVILKSELPGIPREDMEVTVENTYVKLSGQKRRIPVLDDEEIYRTEQFYGRFSRIIPLPYEVQPDKAIAEYKDGILTVIIPKSDNKTSHGRKLDIK